MSRAGPAPELVLGIETSCDETAASIVRNGREVLSNVIASQDDLHAEYRGVVPEIASRAHAERLLPIVRRAMTDAGVAPANLDAVAVGNRPGLIGCLLVGVAAAKALSWGLGVPVIGVDHVHAHLTAGLLRGRDAPSTDEASLYPALGLIVSGGHTSMYLCESTTRLRRLGGTIDDALGEAYDKVAAILGLPFPGGPRVDRLAAAHPHLAREPDASGGGASPVRVGFPIARIAPESLDFSFSGLKTAALYAFRGVPETERARAKREARGEPAAERWRAEEVAASFQLAAIRTVELKLERAMDRFPAGRCRSLLVGGGVSANSALRAMLRSLAERRGVALRLPEMAYCLDNAAMIAAMGHDVLRERAGRGDDWTMTATPTTGS